MTGHFAHSLRRLTSGIATGALAVGGMGVFAAAIAWPHTANARTEHHHIIPVHHYIARKPATAPAETGFGPTAPGMSAILIDAKSGAVMSAIGADIPRYPASLTKLMTLDLTFQALRDGKLTLNTPLPVSEHAAAVEPVKLGLQPGDTITVQQAILAMTTMSANDAATALGEYLGGGSEYRCGQMMTLRAHALGMAQTQFYNASGLPNPNQVTTARDLSILARDIVLSYPQDQQFFEVQKFSLNGRMIYSNNQMLKIYPGATGMKTGYTTLARHNLVTSAERNGRTLIGVVLHEPSWGTSYSQMTAMLNNGFGQTMVASNQPPATVNPPTINPPASTGPSLITSAAAATIRPATIRPASAAAGHARQRAEPIQLATSQPAPQSTQQSTPQSVTRDMIPGWTAAVGTFKRMDEARTRAISIQRLRGIGVARIARLQSHGHTLWTAQLAGLTHNAAHATCSVLTARHTACTIIAPQSDHLASRSQSDG